MYVLIFIIGLIIGIILNCAIKIISNGLSNNISNSKNKRMKILVPVICALSFEILFLPLGFTTIFTKGIAMTMILIIISVIDLRHRIIPDFMVAIALVIGIIFAIMTKVSVIDTLLGMVCGGELLFLLALVQNAMGGGDIKIMFAIGGFLWLNRTLRALLIAFSLSSINKHCVNIIQNKRN